MISSLLLSVLLAALLYGTVSSRLLAGLCGGLFLLLTVLRRKKRHAPSPWMQMDVLAQSSRLSGWNPGLKACVSCALLLLCVGADSLYLAAFLAVAMTVLNLATSRISAGDYLVLLSGPVTFLSLSGLVLPSASASPPPPGRLPFWSSPKPWERCAASTHWGFPPPCTRSPPFCEKSACLP